MLLFYGHYKTALIRSQEALGNTPKKKKYIYDTFVKFKNSPTPVPDCFLCSEQVLNVTAPSNSCFSFAESRHTCASLAILLHNLIPYEPGRDIVAGDGVCHPFFRFPVYVPARLSAYLNFMQRRFLPSYHHSKTTTTTWKKWLCHVIRVGNGAGPELDPVTGARFFFSFGAA